MKTNKLLLAFALFVLTSCKLNSIDAPKTVTVGISGNTLILNWSSVRHAEKYHVFRRLAGTISTNGAFLEMNDNPTSTTYTEDLGFPDGTTYTYQVVAEKEGLGGQKIFSDYTTSNPVTH